MPCGSGGGHCCWLGTAGECKYVEPSTLPGRNWQCSLYVREGNWDAVYTTPEYQADVRPALDACGYPNIGCGDWPLPGTPCNTCGQTGSLEGV